MSILQFIFIDTILDVLYFPVWWYTDGLAAVARFIFKQERYGINFIGIRIWAKSLFKPMYGVTTLQARIISFFMRIVVLIWDTLLLIIWTAVQLLLLALWLVALPVLFWQLISVLTH